MSENPTFPPLFRPFAVTPDVDPFERCCGIAAEGAEAGTLLWSIGQEACECAVVLAPGIGVFELKLTATVFQSPDGSLRSTTSCLAWSAGTPSTCCSTAWPGPSPRAAA